MAEAVADGRRHPSAPQAWWTAIPEPSGLAEDCLAIDDQTSKDLEIFEARGAGYSVHGLLSLTKTAGGAAVLRGRMMRPWSSAHRIREVQESLRYIIAHRSAFDCLPSEVVAHGAFEYLYGGLPAQTSRNTLVVLFEALSIRWGESLHYTLIRQGVIRTVKLLHGLSGSDRLPPFIKNAIGYGGWSAR